MACSGTGAIDGFLSPASSGWVHAHSDRHGTAINNNGQIETSAAVARTTSAQLRVRAAYMLALSVLTNTPHHAGLVIFTPVSAEPGFASPEKSSWKVFEVKCQRHQQAWIQGCFRFMTHCQGRNWNSCGRDATSQWGLWILVNRGDHDMGIRHKCLHSAAESLVSTHCSTYCRVSDASQAFATVGLSRRNTAAGGVV